MHRLRVRFNRGEGIKYISHLDIIRLWERVFRRSQIPLAYSEGFSPHPRLSLAAPLPLEVTSEAELMDVFVSTWVSPHRLVDAVKGQLPPGLDVLGVYQIALSTPSLQSQLRYAEYEVEVETEKERKDTETAVAGLLSAKHLPWQHLRDTGPRRYDLRALIDDLWLIEGQQPHCTLGMRLRCDSSGSGRPEQVATALGFKDYPQSIHRTKLILKTS